MEFVSTLNSAAGKYKFHTFLFAYQLLSNIWTAYNKKERQFFEFPKKEKTLKPQKEQKVD